jgi:hypothetical protein
VVVETGLEMIAGAPAKRSACEWEHHVRLLNGFMSFVFARQQGVARGAEFALNNEPC